MKYCLQNRWRIEDKELVYYGMRKKPHLLRNRIRISAKVRAIVASLPREIDEKEKHTLRRIIGDAVVPEAQLCRSPASVDDAVFCKNCAANDFMIPGIEFDDDGLCPMCANAGRDSKLGAIVPVVTDIPRSDKSDFDVGLFYTGGKDSTFLLWYLAKVKKLRVLAMTWEIPWMSDSARTSIDRARERFDNVKFIRCRLDPCDESRFYAKLYSLAGNTCACPSLAYVLFYPEMVRYKVPCFVTGTEPAQMLGLYYNHIAPAFAYRFAQSRAALILLGIARVLTLRPPLRRGQFHSLITMHQLAFGMSGIVKRSGYENELVSNVIAALGEVPHLVEPLRRAVRESSRTGNIPAFLQLDMNTISGGIYDWSKVKQIITEDCGWIAPEGKGLHTSCRIERCKEYTQFRRFCDMKSRMIPFSAIEMSLATRDRSLTRDEAIAEIRAHLGFTLEDVPECALMHEIAGNAE